MITQKEITNLSILEYLKLLRMMDLKPKKRKLVDLNTLKEAKRIWIYARVSTEEQGKGVSQENQIERITSFLTSNNLQDKILKPISEIHSAKTSKRPLFEEMISKLLTGDIIIVLWWSRFYRNFKEKIYLTNMMQTKEIYVYAVDSTNDPFASDITSLIDEDESVRTSDRVKSLMEKKFQDKKFLSRPPFGYVSVFKKTQNLEDKGKLAIDKAKAPIVKDIFKRFLEGTGITELSKSFNLSYKTIKGILSNRVYNGNYCFGNVWKEAKELKIIELDLFEKVQKKLN